MGDLCLKKGYRMPDKGSVCQLLHGCCEILQRLAALVYPGLKLRPLGRRYLVFTRTVPKCLNDVFVRRLGRHVVKDVSSLAM